MARILVHPRFQHCPPLQTQALVGPSHLLLRQRPLLPRGWCQTLPLPSHCQWPPPPHTHLRSRPPHPKLRCAQGHERLLAQGPEMDDEQLLLYPHLHLVPGGLPPLHFRLLQIQKALCRPQGRMRPPEHQPGLCQTPTVFPLTLLPQGPGLLQSPYHRALRRLAPPHLAYEGPLSASKKAPPH